MADENRAAALTIAADAVRAEYRDRKRCRPDACRQCADMDQPIADALGEVLRELELMAASGSPDARERLARHLYVEASALEVEAGKRWDTGQVHPDRRNDYRRAADRILNVITGQEN